jgi:hypothetical protein
MMHIKNLAVVFGPNLLRPRVATAESMISQVDSSIVDDLLRNVDTVFSFFGASTSNQ